MEDRSKEQNTQSCEAHVHFTSEELLDLIGSPTIPEQRTVVDFSVVKNKAAESVTEYSSCSAWDVSSVAVTSSATARLARAGFVLV